MKRWYRDCRSTCNSKWGMLEGKVRKEHKQHKQHKSKYQDLFKGKSKEEISSMIDDMDISKQMKHKLRNHYVK